MRSRSRMITASGISVLMAFALAGSASAWELQWFGQSAVKITSPKGKVILVDPFITNNPVTPGDLKDLKTLGKVDLILLTHGHGDHIGDTAEIAKASGVKVALNADLGQTLGSLDIVPAQQLIRFNKGGPIRPVEGIAVTMVHAEHSSEVVHTDPGTGEKRVHPGGEPAGYIIELEDGYRIYHAGDTGIFGDMRFVGEYFKPDLALLPIGGHFTMDPGQAAFALRNLLKTKNVIPIHYGTFPPLTGTPEEFRTALGNAFVNLIVMKPGETRSF